MGKKFSIDLTLADYYGIRNALRETGKDPELLRRIEDEIEMLHAYFDGRLRLPYGVRPHLTFWNQGGVKRDER